MRAAFITVGDPSRLTGGYLYHAEVFARISRLGISMVQIVASGANPQVQREAAHGFCRQFDPRPFDIIVVDALAATVCAPGLDRWRAQRPVVAMVHELPSVASNADAASSAEAPLLRADVLIAVSAHGQAVLIERGVPAERIIIARPGANRLRLSPRTTTPPSGPVMVLAVAQWIPRKGILTLVEAWTQLDQRNARLMLIGETDADPAYAAQVRAVIRTTPHANIEARGPVSDAKLVDMYHRTDIFALPTRYEGYGMVFAEAMIAGIPVIAGAVGPVPGIVGNGGILVPPDDVPALVQALDTMIGNPYQRQAYAVAARQRAANLPTWEVTTTAFTEALTRAVHRPLAERTVG